MAPVAASFASIPDSSLTYEAEQTATARLVWCHEFCHNTENRARRHLLKSTMHSMNWTVTFCKKPEQFTKWCEQAGNEDYVLVMGWREAQPCLRYLSRRRNTTPMMSVIICTSPKQHARALRHIETLPAAMRYVHACFEEEIPEWMLGGRIRQCFSTCPEVHAVTPQHAVGARQQQKPQGMNYGAASPYAFEQFSNEGIDSTELHSMGDASSTCGSTTPPASASLLLKQQDMYDYQDQLQQALLKCHTRIPGATDATSPVLASKTGLPTVCTPPPGLCDEEADEEGTATVPVGQLLGAYVGASFVVAQRLYL